MTLDEVVQRLSVPGEGFLTNKRQMCNDGKIAYLLQSVLDMDAPGEPVPEIQLTLVADVLPEAEYLNRMTVFVGHERLYLTGFVAEQAASLTYGLNGMASLESALFPLCDIASVPSYQPLSELSLAKLNSLHSLHD